MFNKLKNIFWAVVGTAAVIAIILFTVVVVPVLITIGIAVLIGLFIYYSQQGTTNV